MNSHHKALEFDLADMGIDLLDFWRGRITLRRMRVLIDGLPLSSAFWSAAAGHGDERWTQSDHHLARVIDILGVSHLQDYKRMARPGEDAAIERLRSSKAQRFIDREKRKGASKA